MTSQFGTLLRQLRLRSGVTQEQLSERSQLSVKTIRDLETGKRTNPQVRTVNLVADALELTPRQRQDLLALTGGGPPPGATGASRSQASAPPDPLADDAEDLAREVERRWRREEEHRCLHPFHLPVRWQSAPAHLTDHWETIPLDLTGDVDDIASTYRQIPSGRLVVLGGAGSGKTVLALRFVGDCLRTRTDADPVPVTFSLGSWDPNTTGLRDWLTGQLLRDYPHLVQSTRGGSTLAAALVDANRILPVLDGFDEIAGGLYGPALEQLNATSLQWLLTSRPKEYDEAVAATGVVTRAAGVQLLDLAPTELVNYLRTTRRATWVPVLDDLCDRPDSPLAIVLRTPLMVFLARTVYSGALGQNPAVLLDTTRFPTQQAIEDHLLDNFVPTLYRQRPPRQPVTDRPRQHRTWEPDRAHYWLGYLAQHLDQLDTRDLAWWQLGATLRRSSRVLVVVLACTLATTSVAWLLVPLYMAYLGTVPGLKAGLMDVLACVAAVGLPFGLMYWLTAVRRRKMFEPSRVQVRIFGRTSRPGTGLVRKPVIRFRDGLLGGAAAGLGYGLTRMLAFGVLYGFSPHIGVAIGAALIDALFFAPVFGLAAGLAGRVTAALEAPLDISCAAHPARLLTTSRGTVMRHLLVIVPIVVVVIALGGQIVVELLQEWLGPLIWGWGGLLIGMVAGLGGGLSYVFTFTAWGQWMILTRIWLPLTGRLPWAVITFLDDAHQRGVLRQVGAVYQFRHARLQDRLKASHQHGRPTTTNP
ncbi:helix-turn-helix domain-containing protein [Dactylosporangium sp. NPDC005572]|uniref:helix-turn-helix domain-containing protein n=1 Tax=Dactylosporangium sp. NPDC005572 TaxID=3156889 RepID=UPI0033B1D299